MVGGSRPVRARARASAQGVPRISARHRTTTAAATSPARGCWWVSLASRMAHPASSSSGRKGAIARAHGGAAGLHPAVRPPACSWARLTASMGSIPRAIRLSTAAVVEPGVERPVPPPIQVAGQDVVGVETSSLREALGQA